MIDLSLILPAWNEAPIIAASVRAVDRYLTDLALPFEILVGDDGSTDDTAGAALKPGLPSVRVVTRPHSGKGGIISACVLESQGAVIGFLDSDLEIPVDCVSVLLERVREGWDVAIASKAIDAAAARRRPLPRRMATLAFNTLARITVHSHLRDHQAGLKLFPGDYLRSLVPRIRNTGWLWDTEVLAHCLRDGLKVVEVPVATTPRAGSKVSMAATSWRMFWDLLKLRSQLKKGAP